MKNPTDITIQNRNPLLFPIVKFFLPNINPETIIITFATKVYTRGIMTADLMEHEKVHCRQQRYSKFFATIWCVRYLISKKFRYKAETEAYQIQYRYARDNYSRNEAYQILMRCAQDLSGPIYNNIISLKEAVEEIKQ